MPLPWQEDMVHFVTVAERVVQQFGATAQPLGAGKYIGACFRAHINDP
jgi:hypothetical protein